MAEASGSSGARAADVPKSSEEVISQFQGMKQEIDQLSAKINEFDNETQEHALVLKALEPMDPSRKCFRLIGRSGLQCHLSRTQLPLLPLQLAENRCVGAPVYMAAQNPLLSL